jgi:ankyrin repeat protein
MKRKRVEYCSICLNTIEKNIFTTNCGHSFHIPCLIINISTSFNQKCPLCRKEVSMSNKNKKLIRFIRVYSTFSINNSVAEVLLHACIRKNNTKCLKFILNNLDNEFLKMDIDSCYNGVTPLILCSKLNRVLFTRLLINKSASILVKDTQERTPLSYACENGDFYTVELILASSKNSVSLVLDKDIVGLDSMIYSIIGGNVNIFDLLYSIVPQFNEKSTYKFEPITYAITYNRYEMFLRLFSLKMGDLKILDIEGNNLLHYTTMYNNILAFKYIYENKRDLVLEKNIAGETPLHIATKNNCFSIIKYFMYSDINFKRVLSIKDSTGKNCFELAFIYKRNDILDFFVYSGYLKKNELRLLITNIT